MLTKELLQQLQSYVGSYLNQMISVCMESTKYSCRILNKTPLEIEDYIEQNRKPTFNQVLMKLIDGKITKDAVIYTKAGIDRRHFSKMRDPDYHPGKKTVIALAFALNLSKQEADSLLESAGYALSKSDIFDLVIQFCLKKKIYDIHDMNVALDYFSLKPLGGEG